MKVKNKMAEFLLELFSEEIPSNLQASARLNLLTNFKNFLEKENINYNSDAKIFSTPNRLVLFCKKRCVRIEIPEVFFNKNVSICFY